MFFLLLQNGLFKNNFNFILEFHYISKIPPEVPLPREDCLPPLPELEEGGGPEGHEAGEGHGHAVVEEVRHLLE